MRKIWLRAKQCVWIVVSVNSLLLIRRWTKFNSTLYFCWSYLGVDENQSREHGNTGSLEETFAPVKYGTMLRNRYPLNSGVITDASSPHSFYLQMIYNSNFAKEVGNVSVQREYAECPGSEPSLHSICGTHKKVRWHGTRHVAQTVTVSTVWGSKYLVHFVTQISEWAAKNFPFFPFSSTEIFHLHFHSIHLFLSPSTFCFRSKSNIHHILFHQVIVCNNG